MLVLSRRLNEKVLFPTLNTAVQVVSITGGTVRLFPVAPSCTAPLPVPNGCATSAQFGVSLPPAPMTAMLHSIDVGADGGLYIATLGGDLSPQKWAPVAASRPADSPREQK